MRSTLLVSDGVSKLAWDGDDRMPKVVMPMVVLPNGGHTDSSHANDDFTELVV